MPRTSTVLTVAGVTTVAAAVGYAIWFDQKRRNDAEFRKQLRKEKKKITKSVKLAESEASTASAQEYDFEGALEELRKEPIPSTPQESETLFLDSVGKGDQLAGQGPLFYFPAAVSYYRALRVYPMPSELLGMYKDNVLPPVFVLIVQLMNYDLKSKAEGYYQHFPPVSMGVEVKELPMNKNGKPVEDEPGKPLIRRRALVARKDFAAGELIYTEKPMAAALDLDLEGKGTHCSNCLRELEPMLSIPVPNDPLGTTYCSKACQLASSASWHNLLFGDKSITSQAGAGAHIASPAEEAEQQKKRRQAQEAFVEHVKAIGKVSPLHTARFIGRMISGEISKVLPSEATPAPPSDLPEPDGGATAAFYDHIDRMRYLEVEPSEDEGLEMTLLKDMLNGAMAGLEEFIKDDRYLVLKGKVLFNAIGITYSGGRLNKPKSGERFESWDLTRTPYGTSRQTGSGFYRVSSYLAHSCSPSVRPSFPKGTSELHLVANKDIKAGDELTMSYVRSTPTEGETALDNRKTRRQELARGWRFACECSKCAEELEEMEKAGVAGAQEKLEEQKPEVTDETKVEDKSAPEQEVRAAEEEKPVDEAESPATDDDVEVVEKAEADSEAETEAEVVEAEPQTATA